MIGTSCWFVRRVAVLVGALAALGLLAAPVALADGDTITPQATVQFSGVVDQSPSCGTAGGAATIDWGDSTAASNGTINGDGSISGSHTYATKGTYFGTITITGQNCNGGGGASDSFTANVSAAPPQFTQCPPVDQDTGCQFLVVATDSGATILVDGNQPAYDDGGDDALIGVQNNGSAPISSIPLSASQDLFGFEADGLCDPGSPPVPSGCAVVSGTGGCGTGAVCAFPKPAGQPAGYTEPEALPGSTQNGYEGPTSWFTNIDPTDAHSGVVHFSPAIPPGGSSYFSLEEPPVGTLNAGGTPGNLTFASPPKVTATGASFSAFVNPNGSPTTARFQYGLDLRYTRPGGHGPNYTNFTPVQTVGSDFSDHLILSTVKGLVPNAVYHARMVATNGGGTTFGPDITFKTKLAAPPGAPTLGRTFNLAPVRGIVLVKVHGVFIPLTQLRQFPKNTLINALRGTLQVITAAGGHPATDAAAKGKKHKGKSNVKTQTGRFSGAIFKITQAHNGLATLSLVEGAVKGGPSFAKCKGKAGDASAASSRTLQLLRSSAKGKFGTKGKYAAATVRGTKWTTADRCDGTQVHVNSGSVAVTDFVRHKTVVLHGGQTYLAKKP
jgi:hypothetical protein